MKYQIMIDFLNCMPYQIVRTKAQDNWVDVMMGTELKVYEINQEVVLMQMITNQNFKRDKEDTWY